MKKQAETGKTVQILKLLEGVRQSGEGWTAFCPAHGDERSSLSIGEGKDGRVLLHCFAGCDIADIVAGLGLEVSDLFPRNRTKILRKGSKRRDPQP